MNFEKLLSEGKIEKIEKTDFVSESVEKSLQFAVKGMETESYDEVMSVVYSGIFKISSRLINFLGYRAVGKEHHKNTFEFLKKMNINLELVDYFDNLRKKRNDFLYRDIETTTKDEAEQMIVRAREFVQEIKKFCKNFRKSET